MHLGLKTLQVFLASRDQDSALVLATVVDTEGSTYRKSGAMMLIDRAGDFAGLVSGGCLEGDLVSHAAEVFSDGKARLVSYDLRDDDELLLGLGLGCGGSIHLLLQRLERHAAFAPLGPMLAALDARRACRLALVCAAGDGLPLGAWSLLLHGAPANNDLAGDAVSGTGDARLLQAMQRLPRGARRSQRYRLPLSPGQGAGEMTDELADVGADEGADEGAGEGAGELLLMEADPSPHVLICGAGPDALPLVRQVSALGWDCTVTDHRPAFVVAGRFPAGVQLLCQRPEALRGALVLSQVDAAVVMTHHVGHDAHYLAALADQPPRYLGLLGPRARRERLLDDIDQQALTVHGPAGLDIGAELPEAIALAIIAEIHAVLAARPGTSLTDVAAGPRVDLANHV